MRNRIAFAVLCLPLLLAPAALAVEPAPSPTLASIRTTIFTDLPGEDSRYDAAAYMTHLGTLTETGTQTFSPDGLVSRSTVLLALFRLSGEPAPVYDGRFSDLPADSWFAPPAAWAAQAGLATPDGAGRLNSTAYLTRAELCTMLYQYAAYRGLPTGYSVGLDAYRDGGAVAQAQVQAVCWAAEQGLLRALVSDRLYPNFAVSRGQLAQVLTALVAHSTGAPLAAEIAGTFVPPPSGGASLQNHAAIQAAVEDTAKKYGAMGVQVAVVEHGIVTDTFAYGWATKDTDPMTADHKLRTASLSKVLVGMDAMLLREQGVISLDEDIGTYWKVTVKNPYYPQSRITIRSLLSHTSSILVPGGGISNYHNAVQTALSQKSGYSNRQPGVITSWAYNNYGFSVLGMTLELAAGRTLEQTLHQQIFDPLDIDGSFGSGSIRNTDLLATIYERGGGVGRSVATQKSIVAPTVPGSLGAYFAGGFTASAADMGKLTALLANDGRYAGLQLLPPAAVAAMERCNTRMIGGEFYQALPLRLQYSIYGRDSLYYHTGSAYGVYNLLSYDPATGDGVVVLSTGASGTKDSRGIYAVCGEISSYIYETIG